MNAIDVIKFIGHSSSSQQLDDYLESIGVNERPQKNEEYVFIKNKSLHFTLTFQSYLSYSEESLTPPINKGKFVLQSINFQRSSTWTLPYNLEFSTPIDDLEKKIGPIKKTSTFQGDKKTLIHTHNNLLIVAHIKGHVIESISFENQDIYAKNQGLI